MSASFTLSQFAEGTATRVDVDGVPVAVVRIKERVFAIADTCSHAAVSLSDGEVWCEEMQLECPKHGSAFSLVTGEPDTLPATQPVAVYAVSIDGDTVVISGGAS
ncbi:MAG: non-heme iron oxygenase ferredoxin subunit [Actinomycetota bacterium]